MAKRPVKPDTQDVLRKDGGAAYPIDDDELEVVDTSSERAEYPSADDRPNVVWREAIDGGRELGTLDPDGTFTPLPRVGGTYGADETALYGFDCIALDSEGKPRQLVAQDTPMQVCSVVLSRAVLIALLDPTHALADADTADKLWLLDEGELTPIGALIIAGTDQTALRAKMATAWRNAYNAEILSKKG